MYRHDPRLYDAARRHAHALRNEAFAAAFDRAFAAGRAVLAAATAALRGTPARREAACRS